MGRRGHVRPPAGPGRRAAGALVVVLPLAVAACGLPADGTSATIPPDQLPYGLEQTAARPTTGPTTPNLALGPMVWLVREDALTAIPAPSSVNGGDSPQVVAEALLARLANGPDETDLAAGLRTALGPTMTLRLVEIRGGTAVVDLDPGTGGQGGAGQLPLAAGQVVLTLTSIPAVNSVELVHDGESLPVPLPGGVLTTRALTAPDYYPLVAAPTPSTGTASTGTAATTP